MVKIKKHHIKYIFVSFLLVSVILVILFAKNIMYSFAVYSKPSPASKIVFFGRVIDQYGKPVENAKVDYSQGVYRSTATNSNGEFKIHGYGKLIRIDSIRHDLIDFHHNPAEASYSSTSRQDPIAYSLTFYRYISEGSNLLSYSTTTKDSPHIFKAWRIEKNTKNIVHKGKLLDRMVADGRIYTIDFRKKSERLIEGSHRGQLRASCKRKMLKTKVERREHNDWEFILEAVDGGIQETSDYYLNAAPNEGYKKKITVKYLAGEKNYKHYFINNRYYFKSNNGNEVGAIFLELEPFGKMELCTLMIHLYKYNNKGSHNLVFKKQQK